LLSTASVGRERIVRGEVGEELAVRELERRGYVILARRYRRRGGEIDIIAMDGPTLVFVEVKARAGHEFGDGAEAVHRIKRRRIAEIALDYAARHRRTDGPCRFDVVAIRLGSGEPVVEVFPNAFDMMLS